MCARFPSELQGPFPCLRQVFQHIWPVPIFGLRFGRSYLAYGGVVFWRGGLFDHRLAKRSKLLCEFAKIDRLAWMVPHLNEIHAMGLRVRTYSPGLAMDFVFITHNSLLLLNRPLLEIGKVAPAVARDEERACWSGGAYESSFARPFKSCIPLLVINICAIWQSYLKLGQCERNV